jgi:hypothetical protein
MPEARRYSSLAVRGLFAMQPVHQRQRKGRQGREDIFPSEQRAAFSRRRLGFVSLVQSGLSQALTQLAATHARDHPPLPDPGALHSARPRIIVKDIRL